MAPGDDLGRLVGVEVYWVVASVPRDRLRFLAVPRRPGETGARVTVRDRAAWPEGVVRDGRVVQLLGELAGQTRMARVLVEVDDPLALDAGPETPPLMLGTFVEVRLEGEPLDDVVRIDRDHVRQGDTVWVMADDRLEIREVEIVVRDALHAYVASGLEDGEQVVTSNLATVVEGARLRVEGEVGEVGEVGEQSSSDPSSDDAS